MRSQSIACRNTPAPPPTPPSTAPSGTHTWSNDRSPSGDVRRPNFSIVRLADTPAVSRPTTKAVTPPWNLVVASVTAKTTITCASGPFDTKVFDPLIRQPSPFFTARGRIANGSDPESDSVMACAQISEPLQSPGRYRRICSSVPNLDSAITDVMRCALTLNTSPWSLQP